MRRGGWLVLVRRLVTSGLASLVAAGGPRLCKAVVRSAAGNCPQVAYSYQSRPLVCKGVWSLGWKPLPSPSRILRPPCTRRRHTCETRVARRRFFQMFVDAIATNRGSVHVFFAQSGAIKRFPPLKSTCRLISAGRERFRFGLPDHGRGHGGESYCFFP